MRDGELDVSLVKFRAFQFGTPMTSKDGSHVYPRTQCAFWVRERGRETFGWRPVSFEISDATGNHWRPFRDERLEGVEGALVQAGFLGALWPEEDAWKLRVEFRKVTDFQTDELLRMTRLPLPGDDEVLQPSYRYEVNGTAVEVAALIG